MTEEEKPRPRILKVEASTFVGLSVQTEDGDWIKTGTTLNTHIGPGYPSREMLRDILRGTTLTAYENNVDQIELVIKKTNEKVAKIGG